MQGIFQKENTDKALKYGIYRHLPTYEKIIRNLVSFYIEKIERYNKRQDIRDDILKQFWNKLQELNDTFVQTNIAAMRDSSVAGNSIGIFESVILDIVRYYDTNEFDLKVFKKEYNDFNDAWIDFKNTYVSYMGKRLDRKMQNQLGEKLQLVKEKNQTLISEVRKKY